MPKVTVITGYYNRGAALEMTVRAILAQTFTDFEFIIFDDASTDDTAERMAALEKELNDPRLIFIVHPKNKGFTRGLIDAVPMAKGEYIAIQGSGDVSLPRRLELQVAVLDSRPEVAAVGGWYSNVVEDKGISRLRQPDANNTTYESLQRGAVYSHGEVMFRRSVYDAVGGYRAPFKFVQDYDLWLRMVQVARLATVPEEIYRRFVRFDGVSYDPKKLAVQVRYGILARRINNLPKDQQPAALAELEEKGPVALVDKAHPLVQKRYVKAALRSIAWGGTKEAAELARNDIIDPLRRNAIIALAGFYTTPLAWPVRKVAQRVLGIDG